MKPTRDTDDAIVDLVDVILQEGTVVEADVIISVADIPLIGLKLRAALAGMTTMTEYGHFKEWDAVQRQRSMNDEQEGSSQTPTSKRWQPSTTSGLRFTPFEPRLVL